MKAFLRIAALFAAGLASLPAGASPVTLSDAARSVTVWHAGSGGGIFGPNSPSGAAGSFADAVGVSLGGIAVDASQSSGIDAGSGIFSGKGAVSVGFSVQNADEVMTQSYYRASFTLPTAMNYVLRGMVGAYMDGGLGMGSVALVDHGAASEVFQFITPGSWDALSFSSSGLLAAGSYSLLAGAMISPDHAQGLDAYMGGSAEYEFHFEVAAVPEPETWALMMAGLSLLGFAARRRV